MCVLGLGLIGGSIMRAAAAAGRDVFGYNRSVEGAQGARKDGFDATTDLTDALTRANDTNALIVLAVPMPALPSMLAHIRDVAPDCPLTDVTSVKGAVLDAVTEAGLQKLSGRTGRGGTCRAHPLRQLPPLRHLRGRYRRGQLAPGIGGRGPRRRGDQIRSANPG